MNEQQQEYIKFIKYYRDRLNEILYRIEHKTSELPDGDVEFLAAISKTYYQKVRNK